MNLKAILAAMNTIWSLGKIGPVKVFRPWRYGYSSIARVMVVNPVLAWIFVRPYFHYCSSGVHFCKNCFHIHLLIRSSLKWISYIHSHLDQSKVRVCSSLIFILISWTWKRLILGHLETCCTQWNSYNLSKSNFKIKLCVIHFFLSHRPIAWC